VGAVVVSYAFASDLKLLSKDFHRENTGEGTLVILVLYSEG
jgi:hypothetical protein